MHFRGVSSQTVRNLMKNRIKPNDENFNFVDAEHRLLKFWNEEKIFKKSLEKNPSSNPYIFYDGPPFATGLPHHGHLVGSILKDAVPRYWTMKGICSTTIWMGLSWTSDRA